jgi:tRNA A37 threonylcarbamoyltransferase TsaD
LKPISYDPWLHRENVLTVLREALEEANMSPDQVDAVAYTKVLYIHK